MAKKTILVVEDEENIRELICLNLQKSGFEVLEAGTGERALEIFAERGEGIDMVMLDIMLPGIDGLSVCRQIREKNSAVGIIMLTAKTQEMDKISGLMLGADDYVTKPVSVSELMARVDAIYRRVALASDRRDSDTRDELLSGEFSLNLRNRSFRKNGKPIELTQVEFQIMEYFFSNPGMALNRGDILKHVWGAGYTGEEKIVDVNIRRLRMKVEEEPSNPQHIVTVWGLGYRWDA